MSQTDDRGRSSSPRRVNKLLWKGSKPQKSLRCANFPTLITGELTLEQMTAYQTMLRIQEITDILQAASLKVPSLLSRSESPPPTYDEQGKRTNTKEQRYRKKLELERYRLVEIATKLIPFYKPPDSYMRLTKFEDKYYIPVEQYPEINFVGLLLGPRGKTLKQLQLDSKCKIAIRGRGSVKEGKGSNDLPEGAMNMEDPLHCLVIADSEEKVYNGIKACQAVVIKAVTSPEGQNDLKRNQLRDLAELNGTLREEVKICTLCGLQGHKRYTCPNKQTNYAQKVICHKCGQPGHTARDCVTQTSSIQNNYNNNYHNDINSGSNSRYAYNQWNNLPPNEFKPRTNNLNANNTNIGRYQSRHQRSNINSAENDSQIGSNKTYTFSNRDHQAEYSRFEKTDTSNATSSYSNPNEQASQHNDDSNIPPGMDVPVGPPGIDLSNGAPGLEQSLAGPPGLEDGSNEPTSHEIQISDTNEGMSGPPGIDEGISGPPGIDEGINVPPGIDVDITGQPGIDEGITGPPGLTESIPGPPGLDSDIPGPPGLDQDSKSNKGKSIQQEENDNNNEASNFYI